MVREILKRKGWLMPEEAIGLLNEYGITVAETLVARSAEEAALAADKLGYPVVMKIRSSRIVHKTDVGGIAAGLKDAEDVKRAFSMMRLRVESAGFAGETDGVILQRMAKGGQEMIVGMSQDPLFGPLVMIGLGGVSVELLKDVAFSIHPLRDADTDRMLRELKSLPLLQGYRGRPLGDIMALKEALLRFSSLVEDFPEIDQIEINPLLVLEDGNGVIALDARVYMNPRVD